MSSANLPAIAGKQRWLLPEIDAARAAELAAAAATPLLIAELLLDRGVQTAEEVQHFLHPQLDDLLDPYSMFGMEAAVSRVQAAIRNQELILIYGDYDVDGTTAVVLLKTAIEMLGGKVRFHVPHRLREGYGMQGSVLESAFADGVRLVISVDTGIRAFSEAKIAERLCLDLIVTDHHLPEAAQELPRALVILNPNQPDCEYACKHLCGAGVAFKLSQALLEAENRERTRAKILPSFLKMLVLATVADSVPLLGENRVVASLGLQQLQRPVGAGLRALMEQAKLDPAQRPLTAIDIAFRIAPRINAAGRMDVASDVVELFTTRDAARASELAAKLEQLNADRKQSELAALEQIEQRLAEDSSLREAQCIVVDGQDWHRGVIGILASRVVDRTARPAIVIAVEDGQAYGSGRSVPGFHLLEAIESCAELFSRFGGHEHAVGFSLPTERVGELRERLAIYASEHLEPGIPAKTVECHGVLALGSLTSELYQWLRQFEPFGMGNPEPTFLARNVRLATDPRVMKEKHIRLTLEDGPAGRSISAVGWNWAERAAEMDLARGSVIHIAYHLRRNEHPNFGGLELEIVGMEPAEA
ncbi:MAG TPA: single-stranded-DNA-specific exonuclease RecJ [Acidisarcina sp.]|nr:single-stranded-DNA-specific exonuclease RecJ [Acidisarcina sp.]